MKVYIVTTDSKYQSLTFSDDDDTDYQFDGTSLAEHWQTPQLYSYEPKLLVPDFYDCGTGALAVNERARNLTLTQLETAGELLPIVFEGKEDEPHFLFNVTTVLNVLDAKNSFRGKDSDLLESYSFIKDRLPEFSLFKLVEDDGADIFCVEHSGDWEHEEEFKGVVEHYQLRGLIFEKVWECDAV